MWHSIICHSVLLYAFSFGNTIGKKSSQKYANSLQDGNLSL